MKKKLQGIIRRVQLYKNLLSEVISYANRLFLYNASVRTDDDIKKMQYTILRESHVIEKGMSMRNPRKGFGQSKVLALLSRLEKYNMLYGKKDKDFMRYPLGIIKEYISYMNTSGVEIHTICEQYKNILLVTRFEENKLVSTAGIKQITKQEIISQASGDFNSLLFSRHSIRYFDRKEPEKSVIDQALIMAQQTPSACNRQGWRTHVYLGVKAHDLLHLQGGCNGFEEEISCAIVVTADMRAFLSYEPMQCYVDGGLYAMNLINSLHSLGLGTIPLSLGFYHDKLEHIARTFDIPPSEVMICIIGVGEMLESFKIAESYRKSISITNTYH